jgi:hypothetical protein
VSIFKVIHVLGTGAFSLLASWGAAYLYNPDGNWLLGAIVTWPLWWVLFWVWGTALFSKPRSDKRDDSDIN